MSRMNTSDEDASALFVAYAAGTATEAERAEVEARMQSDPDAAARVALARSSAAALSEQDAAEQGEWSPGEMGYRRLMRDIEREEGAARLAFLDSVAVWRGVAAAAVIALAVVGFWRFESAPAGGQGGYELATSEDPARATAQIAFAPTATEKEIRALLIDAGASLVDGPSALGIYWIAFENDKAREAGLARLRSAAAVERVDAE